MEQFLAPLPSCGCLHGKDNLNRRQERLLLCIWNFFSQADSLGVFFQNLWSFREPSWQHTLLSDSPLFRGDDNRQGFMGRPLSKLVLSNWTISECLYITQANPNYTTKSWWQNGQCCKCSVFSRQKRNSPIYIYWVHPIQHFRPPHIAARSFLLFFSAKAESVKMAKHFSHLPLNLAAISVIELRNDK